MSHRLAAVSGTVTSLVAGAALGLLVAAALGSSSTLAIFVAIALTATGFQRAFARHR